MEKQLTLKGKGVRFSFLFGSVAEKEELKNYQDLIDNQWELLNLFSKACLNHGIFIHTMHHHGISLAHTDEDGDRVLEDIEATLRDVLAEGLNV